uniref:UDP-N-acetylmuramate--alanine ligase n=1 Tax=Tetraselmis sp. GSL018 TaxID=582737 RepID=A0A061SIT2_9CHLO|mmetsp:Transcript_960/g.2284  ORF Transcript_960/g.2284 Transcript_960/m.2284 type:complete len:577 (-) Transcript_960:1069-2799(-)
MIKFRTRFPNLIRKTIVPPCFRQEVSTNWQLLAFKVAERKLRCLSSKSVSTNSVNLPDSELKLSQSTVLERRWVHVVGIGGAGMAPLAAVAWATGWEVSGSDLNGGRNCEILTSIGIRVSVGPHNKRNLRLQASLDHARLPDLVVISSAVPTDNEEVAAARLNGIEVITRKEWFERELYFRRIIAVSGTHGKTTTASFVAYTLSKLHKARVTAIVGGEVPQFPLGAGFLLPALNGKDDSQHQEWYVVEADEYKEAFKGLRPEIIVLTSVDLEHVDCFPDIRSLKKSFFGFIQQLKRRGVILVCSDHPGALSVLELSRPYLEEKEAEILTYGLNSGEWRAVPNEKMVNGFKVYFRSSYVAELRSKLPGQHNMLNTLAAFAATATACQRRKPPLVDLQVIPDIMSSFRGVKRRFEIVGTKEVFREQKVCVIDDYAHHPAEIRVAVDTAREVFSSEQWVIWAVFQPHTVSRLSALSNDFVESLSLPDKVFVLDIYIAREEHLGTGPETEAFWRRAHAAGFERAQGDLTEAAERIANALLLRNGGAEERAKHTAVILLGAGDVTRLGPMLLSRMDRINKA